MTAENCRSLEGTLRRLLPHNLEVRCSDPGPPFSLTSGFFPKVQCCLYGILDTSRLFFRLTLQKCRQLPDYCMLVRRCLITPTRVVRMPPETELSNRILRRYKDHADRFIRVAFGDEDSSTLHLGGRNQSKDIIERCAFILCAYIPIALHCCFQARSCPNQTLVY